MFNSGHVIKVVAIIATVIGLILCLMMFTGSNDPMGFSLPSAAAILIGGLALYGLGVLVENSELSTKMLSTFLDEQEKTNTYLKWFCDDKVSPDPNEIKR